MGPIIGPSTNFATLPDSAKWILSFGMLLGRLEILTVAVLFFPPSGKRRAREIEWRRVSRRRNAEGQPLAALLLHEAWARLTRPIFPPSARLTSGSGRVLSPPPQLAKALHLGDQVAAPVDQPPHRLVVALLRPVQAATQLLHLHEQPQLLVEAAGPLGDLAAFWFCRS